MKTVSASLHTLIYKESILRPMFHVDALHCCPAFTLCRLTNDRKASILTVRHYNHAGYMKQCSVGSATAVLAMPCSCIGRSPIDKRLARHAT
eukprot:3936-Heterococcus_DN1.PRE.4